MLFKKFSRYFIFKIDKDAKPYSPHSDNAQATNACALAAEGTLFSSLFETWITIHIKQVLK